MVMRQKSDTPGLFSVPTVYLYLFLLDCSPSIHLFRAKQPVVDTYAILYMTVISHNLQVHNLEGHRAWFTHVVRIGDFLLLAYADKYSKN